MPLRRSLLEQLGAAEHLLLHGRAVGRHQRRRRIVAHVRPAHLAAQHAEPAVRLAAVQTKAAALLGMSFRSLRYRIKKLNIE